MIRTFIPLIASIVGTLVGAVVGFFLEPVKAHVFGPRLTVRFDPDDEKFVAGSPATIKLGNESECEVCSKSLRISVVNVGRSHLVGSEAFIVDVEHERNGQWRSTAFIDPLRLPWAAPPNEETAWQARDLPRDVRFFVDVCRTTQGIPAQDIPDVLDIAAPPYRPIRLRGLFSEYGRYRITVYVVGHGIKPAAQRMIITWGGIWDKLQAVSA